MASLNNLLISFNFDNVTGSSAIGGVQPYDLVGSQTIRGVNFVENTSSFVLKEEILINKLQSAEIIDGSETISIREEDDLSVSPFKKPTSVKLLLENSMYQIISDEMLNMFSTINNYVIRFSEPANKYKTDYSLKTSEKLEDLRKKYFSKINNNPNLEKYIEFYKWIDSSLGYMLQQLIPENSSNENGLKISIENHVLERSKFTHPLPLTFKNNKNLNSGIVVLKHNSVTSSLSRSLKEPFFTAAIGNDSEIVTTANTINKNYKKNYDFFQTSGKQFNNLGSTTKSVIQSRFSAGDGLSELNRNDNFEEFSVYNSLNNRAKNVRDSLNASSRQSNGIQGISAYRIIYDSPDTLDLLHFENVIIGTSVQNNGASGNVWTRTNTTYAQYENSFSKFGSNCFKFAWQGSGFESDHLLSTNRTLTNFNGERGSYTVEAFWRYPSPSGVNYYGMFCIDDNNGNGIYVYAYGNNLILNIGGTVVHTAINALQPYSTSPYNWFHLALVRDNSEIYIYLDGNKLAGPFASNLGGLNTIRVGSLDNISPRVTANNYFGWIYNQVDEFRVSSKALYTGDTYEVPATAFSDYAETIADFADNDFIQRAVPFTSSNYHRTGAVDLKYFFNDEIKFRQQNNILLEETIYRKGSDDGDIVVEPAVSYNNPAKHLLKVNTGLQDIEIYSPYTNLIETFSPRTLNSKFLVFEQKNITNFFLSDIQTKNDNLTFTKKINLLPNVKIKKYEILENIFPRKDLIGLARTRTKPNFEEEKGTYNSTTRLWSNNSYNNKSSEIRSFWKDSITNRKTTAGLETPNNIGGFNCLGFANDSTLVSGAIENRFIDVSFTNASTTRNFEYASASNGLVLAGDVEKTITYGIGGIYPFFYPTITVTQTRFKGLFISYQFIKNGFLNNSFYSLDAQNDVTVSSSTENSGSVSGNPVYLKNNKFIENDCVVGDLAPNSTFENYKFIDKNQTNLNPKAQFIFNNYFPQLLTLGTPGFSGSYSTYTVSTNPKATASFFANDSYQNNLDNNLKPFYNSYVDYFQNIKHKSQTHSILPEFTIHRNSEIVKGNSQYELCINGNEKYDELNNLTQNFSIQDKNAKDDFIIDFKKIVDPKTNKIKFTLSGVKKLLPYNGFYPNQRIPQIVTLFSSSYLDTCIYSASADERVLETSKRQIHTILQPFFAPGILNNSIKAGLAVDFPLILTGNINQAGNNDISGVSTGSAYLLPTFYSGSDLNADNSLVTINTITKRLPFEAIINPKNYLDSSGLSSDNNFLYHADPLIHNINSAKKFLDSGQLTIPTQHSPRYDIKQFEEKDELYSKAVSNFLAETPNFFLNKSQLTYFVSEPESRFRQVTTGSIYRMRVNIAKSPNFSMFVTGADNFIPVESLFGPPCKLGDTPAFSASLYQPYSPSYFRKNANIVIAVTASRTGTPTLQELQSSYNIYEDTSILTDVPTNLNPTSSTAFVNRMKLDSSLYLFDKLDSKKLSFDTTTGKPTSTNDAQTSDKKWVIKTKFESPLINFSKNTPETNPNNITNNDATVFYLTQGTSNVSSRLSASYTAKVEFKYSSINGIWNRLGQIPEDQNSVQISLSDEGFQGNSLLDVCGFRRESKTISQLADRKTISEGVLLLPFVPANTQNSVFDEDKRNKNLVFDVTEQKYLFTIPESFINSVLKTKNYKSLSIWEIKKIIESNEQIDSENIIVKTISAMINYNIPKHLNWLLDSQITPCVFYVGEFTHTLNKQDLANIWQGTLPTIGLTPEEQEITIEHSLNNVNFFANIRNRMQLYDIKLKIFKIKKRAKISYQQTLEDVEDNLKFSIQKLDYWYSYNWPYDYFSLVELVNIKAGEVFESPEYLLEQQAKTANVPSSTSVVSPAIAATANVVQNVIL